MYLIFLPLNIPCFFVFDVLIHQYMIVYRYFCEKKCKLNGNSSNWIFSLNLIIGYYSDDIFHRCFLPYLREKNVNNIISKIIQIR